METGRRGDLAGDGLSEVRKEFVEGACYPHTLANDIADLLSVRLHGVSIVLQVVGLPGKHLVLRPYIGVRWADMEQAVISRGLSCVERQLMSWVVQLEVAWHRLTHTVYHCSSCGLTYFLHQ